MWVERSAILLPSEAHKNPLPLNQSLLPPSSLTPLSPDAELCSPVCMLPLAANWLALTDSAPIKEKIKKGNKGIALQKSLEATRKEGRINLPLSTAPTPPLQAKLESPPPEPNSVKYQYPSLHLLTSWESPPQQESSVGKEKSRSEKDRLKKKKQKF